MIAFAIDVRIVRIVVDFGLLCTYLARCCCVNLRRHEACILLKVLFFFFRVQSRKIKHNIKRVNACLKGVFPKMMGKGPYSEVVQYRDNPWPGRSELQNPMAELQKSVSKIRRLIYESDVKLIRTDTTLDLVLIVRS